MSATTTNIFNHLFFVARKRRAVAGRSSLSKWLSLHYRMMSMLVILRTKDTEIFLEVPFECDSLVRYIIWGWFRKFVQVFFPKLYSGKSFVPQDFEVREIYGLLIICFREDMLTHFLEAVRKMAANFSLSMPAFLTKFQSLCCVTIYPNSKGLNPVVFRFISTVINI